MGKRIFHISALFCVLAAAAGAFLLLHQTLFRQARVHPSNQISVADIELEPPPNYHRKEFLNEVRYLASWPPYFRLLDEELPRRLAKGFARHPWVEEVEEVRVLPSRVVQVKLKYRDPVLAVKFRDIWRAVDRNGILLPRNAQIDGLPKYMGNAKHPAGPAGEPWGDPAVEQAASKIANRE